MENVENNVVEETVKKKRGRKPKPKEDKIYFGEKEEKAVVDYINSREDIFYRNRLYVTILKPAFKKMIESIIRKYTLYVPDEDFEDTVNDALANLTEQLDKFKPDSGKRAYSYYGTIVKHYVLKRRTDYANNLGKTPSYEAFEDTNATSIPIGNSYERDRHIAEEEISGLLKVIKRMVENFEEEGLKENEVKLGQGLLTLFENWETIIPMTVENYTHDGKIKYSSPSKKLNKSTILLYLKEQTGLDSKNIRTSLKKFKKQFLIIRDRVLNEH